MKKNQRIKCTAKRRLCRHKAWNCGYDYLDRLGYVCTRAKGHKGPHIACVYTGEDSMFHNLKTW